MIESKAWFVVAPPVLAESVAALLADSEQVEILHDSVAGRARVEASTRCLACIVSAELPDGQALAFVRWLDMERPTLPVVLLVERADYAVASAAFALATPVACSPLDAVTLVAHLARVERRTRAHIEHRLRADVSATVERAGLTPREQAICWQSVLGADSKEIAAEEQVAVSTIYAHQTSIRRKLGLATIDDLRWRLLRRVLPDWRR